ncbi:MAG: oxidoreductase, partial [Clostridiaceae bacterium]|nr:oxidoreductase [Clostridiaceae bacterium]
YLRGRKSNDEINEARALTKELMEKIQIQYNTEICKELKQKRISCGEIIDYTYEVLKQILRG